MHKTKKETKTGNFTLQLRESNSANPGRSIMQQRSTSPLTYIDLESVVTIAIGKIM